LVENVSPLRLIDKMIKNNSAAFILSSLLFLLLNGACFANSMSHDSHLADSFHNNSTLKDTVPPSEVMDVINVIITSTDKFDIEAVANLYTPNAVIADDEPPYSWNGPTAGVQWVSAIEQVCKDTHLTKLKASIGSVNVFQQSSDNVYIVVPVTYSGDLPGKVKFSADGAFTFVLRMISGKWMIKEQVWMPRKALR
jgi:ketosteroid isomerase-like protein